jgi:hypothetical protein
MDTRSGARHVICAGAQSILLVPIVCSKHKHPFAGTLTGCPGTSSPSKSMVFDAESQGARGVSLDAMIVRRNGDRLRHL